MQEKYEQSTKTIETGHLKRGIGLIGVSFLVLNGMIGAGIFALPSAIAAQAGLLSPWLFLGVGLLFITVVLTFAELSSYFRESGGPVLYTTAAFGPKVGFNTGWILFLSRLTSFAANTNVMVLYMMSLSPWADDGVVRALLIILICGSLTIVNVIGVKNGMSTIFGFSILKFTPLILMVILGLQYTNVENFSFANLPTIDDLGGTTLLLIYAFIGFEQATLCAGETKNPRRNLPRALVYTIIATGILYFLITLVYISVLPEGGEKGQTLVDVGRVLAGPVGALVIAITAVFSIGGNLASTMLTVPRLTFSLAEKKLLPKWFGAIHHKYETPHNSVKFLGVLAAILALTGSFIYLAMASSLARLVTYILCIASLPIIRKNATEAQAEHVYRLKGGYLIPAIALALCLWIGSQSKLESWLLMGGLLLIGLGLFWLETRSNQKNEDEARTLPR